MNFESNNDAISYFGIREGQPYNGTVVCIHCPECAFTWGDFNKYNQSIESSTIQNSDSPSFGNDTGKGFRLSLSGKILAASFAVISVLMLLFPPTSMSIIFFREDTSIQVVKVDDGFNFIGSIGSVSGHQKTRSVNVGQLLTQLLGLSIVYAPLLFSFRRSH